MERPVIVVNARPIEHPAFGVAFCAEWVGRECGCVEVGPAVSRIVVQFVAAAVIIRHIDTDGIHAIVLYLHEIVVTRSGECNRNTRSEAGYARESPAAGKTVKMEQTLQGQIVVIADDEVMFNIKSRDPVE